MKSIVIATKNKGKLAEFKNMLGNSIEILSLSDFPDIQIIEDGKSFDENAAKKAATVSKATGLIALGDDSGLEVMVLNNRPGIFSARYAGENASDYENNQKLLKELENTPMDRRNARFVCSIALAFSDEKLIIKKGYLEGIIIDTPKGSGGFGYDPIFYLPQYKKTVAELSQEEKNKISHRAKALKKIRGYIMRVLHE